MIINLLFLVLNKRINCIEQLVAFILKIELDFTLDLLHCHVDELLDLLTALDILIALILFGTFFEKKKQEKNIILETLDNKNNNNKMNSYSNIASTRAHNSQDSSCT